MWEGNGSSSYNGKTHKVPRDTLVEPKPGDNVVVYRETGRWKFWNTRVADNETRDTQPPKKTTQKNVLAHRKPRNFQPPPSQTANFWKKIALTLLQTKQVLLTQ